MTSQQPDFIAVGNGATDLIQALYSTLNPTIAIPVPTFAGFQTPLDDEQKNNFVLTPPYFDLDVRAFLEFVLATGADTAIVVNPNNPTGRLVDHEQVGQELAATLCEQARKIVILADHSKFGLSARYRILPYSAITAIITDRKPASDMWFRFLTFAPLRTPILKDVDLRRALALAIDRGALADGLWDGRAKALTSWQLPIFGEINDPNRKGVSYDPAQVKELLAKSSYRGEEIPYPSVGTYYPMQLAENQALVEMWKAAGINVKLIMPCC